MIDQIVKCDRCKNRILQDLSWLRVEGGSLLEKGSVIDLCMKCTGQLVGWLRNDPSADAIDDFEVPMLSREQLAAMFANVSAGGAGETG